MPQTIDAPEIGLHFEFLHTAEETGGAYTQALVTGRPRGFIRRPHVHVGQTERHEVLEGTLVVKMDGVKHVLRPGDSIEIPPGTPHSQTPGGAGIGVVRVTFSDEGTPVRCLAVVAWASFEMPPGSGPRYRAGLQFLDANAETIDAFRIRHQKV